MSGTRSLGGSEASRAFVLRGYTVPVTAKQMLMDYVSGLSEEEALAKLPLLADAGPPPPLTPGQITEIREAIDELDAGRRVSHADVKRRFGLT